MPKTPEEFQTLLADGRQHRADIKTLEERKILIDSEILEHIFESGDTYLTPEGGYKVPDGDGSWSVGARTTKTIDRAMLIALGVEVDLIEQATKTTTGSPYVTYHPKREKKEKTEK